jgi:hypothetical protein
MSHGGGEGKLIMTAISTAAVEDMIGGKVEGEGALD